jgi:hypothetical protein
MQLNLSRSSGVYEIRCLVTNRVYVGSSVNVHARWLQHRNRLRSGRHCNSFLQRAWNSHGENNFQVLVLELFCRQHELDKTHVVAVFNRRICSHRGWTHRNGLQRRDVRTYLGFVSPSGRRVTVTNLQAFCRREGLSPVRMHNLVSGMRRRHKGWSWNANEKSTPR